MTEVIDQRDIDCDRLRRRAGIRADIARRQMLEEKAAAIDEEVRRIHDVTAAAANSHAAICGPLQDELRALEAAAIERIKQRQETDTAADARRREIHAEIQRQNTELKIISDRQTTLAVPLQVEAQGIRMEAWQIGTEMLLASPTAGNPRLLCEQFSLAQRIRFLDARRSVAAEKCGSVAPDFQSLLADKWRHEYATVSAELTAAKAQSEQVYRDLIAE